MTSLFDAADSTHHHLIKGKRSPWTSLSLHGMVAACGSGGADSESAYNDIGS